MREAYGAIFLGSKKLTLGSGQRHEIAAVTALLRSPNLASSSSRQLATMLQYICLKSIASLSAQIGSSECPTLTSTTESLDKCAGSLWLRFGTLCSLHIQIERNYGLPVL